MSQDEHLDRNTHNILLTTHRFRQSLSRPARGVRILQALTTVYEPGIFGFWLQPQPRTTLSKKSVGESSSVRQRNLRRANLSSLILTIFFATITVTSSD